MKRLGAVVVGAGLMAGVALVCRAYIAMDAHTPDWKLAIDALAGVVAALTAVITWRALVVAAASAEAAKDAAQAAMSSSLGMQRIERAYLDFDFKQATWEGDDGAMRVRLRNFGKTPGVIRSRTTQMFAVRPDPFPNPKSILPPHSELQPVAAGASTKHAILRLERGVTHFVLVSVAYEDIFQELRHTCAALEIGGDPEAPHAILIGPSQWNRMD